MKKIFLLIAFVSTILLQKSIAQSWNLTGNAGTTSSHFVGTTDALDLRFRTNNSTRMTINSAGYVGVAVTPESYSRLYTYYSVPITTIQDQVYASMRSRVYGSSATRANGYLGAHYSATLSLGGFPSGLNYMGVLGIKEDADDFGAGVVGWNKGNDGGGIHYGIYGLASGNVTTGTINDRNIGVYGRASNGYKNIGVYGSASGSTDWAGYFSGRGYFSDKLGIGVEDPTSMVTVDAPTSTPIMSLRSNGSTKMYLNASGNLGIGTTAPGVKLHLSGTGELFRLNATSPTMTFHNSSVEKAFLQCDQGNLNIGLSAANTTGNIYMYSAGNARMVLNNNGSVGIGTLATTIDAKLRVDNLSSITQAVFGTSGTGVSILASYPGIAFNSYYTTTFKTIQAGYGADISCDPTNGNLWFRTHSNGAGANSNVSATTRMTLHNDGRLVIGDIAPATNYLVSIDGKVICEELKVQNSGSWPDFVFADNYQLPSLQEIEMHIKTKKHLPGIPSAKEAEADGISVGEMQKKLLEKIEELTLYVIDLEKKVKKLESK